MFNRFFWLDVNKIEDVFGVLGVFFCFLCDVAVCIRTVWRRRVSKVRVFYVGREWGGVILGFSFFLGRFFISVVSCCDCGR